MVNKKPGYLRYKCKSCGAYGTHECDSQRLGLTELVGCTFDEADQS